MTILRVSQFISRNLGLSFIFWDSRVHVFLCHVLQNVSQVFGNEKSITSGRMWRAVMCGSVTVGGKVVRDM